MLAARSHGGLRSALRACALGAAMCALAGCVTPADLLHLDQSAPVLVPAPAAASAIARALHFLQTTQTTADDEARTGADWAGDWPQYVSPNNSPSTYVRDVSPFMVTFIHHALTRASQTLERMTPERAAELGLTAERAAAVGLTAERTGALGALPEAGIVSDAGVSSTAVDLRAMRGAAVAFMRRFEVPTGEPAAGTYGFWPQDRLPASPLDWLLAGLAFSYFGGPVFGGMLGPPNIDFYPPVLAIPPDADDTATVYAALLDDAIEDRGMLQSWGGTGDAVSALLRQTRRSDATGEVLRRTRRSGATGEVLRRTRRSGATGADGLRRTQRSGATPPPKATGSTGARLARFFSDWRDLGQAPRQPNPSWLPPASGAFLTMLAYDDPPGVTTPNDVDLVVNANVLYCLARYGRLDTPGVAEAVGLINAAVAAGFQRTAPGDQQSAPAEISSYYPDNFAFHYCVSRAYREGPVAALAPAVTGLADELEASVQWRADGSAYWDKGDPALNTALAALALMNAGRRGPIVDAAIAYLRAEQDAIYGGWPAGVFFVGRMDNGVVMEWRSAALTTAMCLEALCEYELGV
jgi:hypothetical protein